MRVTNARLIQWMAAAGGLVLVVLVATGMLLLHHRGSNVTAARTATRPTSTAALPSSSTTPPSRSSSSSAPSPPPYQFNPPVSASGASPAVHIVAADLNGSRQIAAGFRVGGAGIVSLHGFGSIGGLEACLEYGQGCQPAGVPNPSYWTLTGDDIAHVGTNFILRINLPGGLAGINVGWNGSHRLTLYNIGMNGSGSGYTAGAGVRYRVTTGGTVGVSSGAGGRFYLKAQDKATATVVPPNGDIGFNGSATITLPSVATWTIYLWSQDPTTASPTLGWP